MSALKHHRYPQVVCSASNHSLPEHEKAFRCYALTGHSLACIVVYILPIVKTISILLLLLLLLPQQQVGSRQLECNQDTIAFSSMSTLIADTVAGHLWATLPVEVY